MAPVINKNQLKQMKKGNVKAADTEEGESSEEQINCGTDEDESVESVETDENVDEGEEEDVVTDDDDDDEQINADTDEESIDEEDNDEFDLNMSDTSSSDGQDDLEEDVEEEENDEVEQEDDETVVPSKEENLRKKIETRYEQTKGKRLYVRFPEKLPADDEKLQEKVKALSTLITEVHRPRQKSARFCLVDFATQTDRDHALENIKKTIKESKDANLKRIVIDVPRTEEPEFVQNLVKNKLKVLEKKRANRKLKKIGVDAEKSKKYTSTLIVTNLPKRTSVLEVRTAFPDAIDVRIKRNKAAVTFPTTFDARKAYKQSHSISGVEVKVRFDKMKPPRKSKPQLKKAKVIAEQSEPSDETTLKQNKKRALPKTEGTIEAGEIETSKKRLKLKTSKNAKKTLK